MTVTVKAYNARTLLKGFIAATKKDPGEEGAITVWKQRPSGRFGYLPKQYANLAYFAATVDSSGILKFEIIRPEGKEVDQFTYAVYHGRLVEILLAHFPDQIIGVSATPAT